MLVLSWLRRYECDYRGTNIVRISHNTCIYWNYPKEVHNQYEKHIQRLIVSALALSTGPAHARTGASIENPSPA